MTYYKESEQTMISFKKSQGNVDRPVCPECINHKQDDPMNVHDCKNIFLNNEKKIIGQCCCWSERHGKRD